VNPQVYKSLGFKVEDLQAVTIGTSFNQTLVCNPAVGVKTVGELVAKAKTTAMSYASGGNGVPGHLSMELLQHMAGFEMTHVPYKGPAPATQDVIGGQVPCGLLAGPTVLPHVRAGKLVALAVSGATRSPTLPDVPTRRLHAGDVRAQGHAGGDRHEVPAGVRRRAEVARRGRQAQVRRPDRGG
jgi:tripartite-type tricarboxylate transporter receptor subunit TctC